MIDIVGDPACVILWLQFGVAEAGRASWSSDGVLYDPRSSFGLGFLLPVGTDGQEELVHIISTTVILLLIMSMLCSRCYLIVSQDNLRMLGE